MDCSVSQPAPFTLGSVVARYDAPTRRVFLEAHGKFITGDFTAAATNQCKPNYFLFTRFYLDLFTHDSLQEVFSSHQHTMFCTM